LPRRQVPDLIVDVIQIAMIRTDAGTGRRRLPPSMCRQVIVVSCRPSVCLQTTTGAPSGDVGRYSSATGALFDVTGSDGHAHYCVECAVRERYSDFCIDSDNLGIYTLTQVLVARGVRTSFTCCMGNAALECGYHVLDNK